MHNLKLKILNIVCLLRCAGAIGWHSLLVILKKNPERQWVNQVAKKTSIKILKLSKTKYSIHYTSPLLMEKNTCYIFMSNHQSLLDIPLIHATVLGTVRIPAKKELFKIPLFGRAMRAAESIMIDRDNPLMMEDFFKATKEKLASGLALWVFPEGTRSASGALLPFKAGCFRLAREVSAHIVPVGITDTRLALPPKKFAFSFHQTVSIRVGKPIDTKNYAALPLQKILMNDVRDAIAQLMERSS